MWSVKNLLWNYYNIGNLEGYETVFSAAAAQIVLLIAPVVAGFFAEGRKVFRRCKACHYVDKEKNKAGRNLVDIIGRAAVAVEGYKYFKKMAG